MKKIVISITFVLVVCGSCVAFWQPINKQIVRYHQGKAVNWFLINQVRIEQILSDVFYIIEPQVQYIAYEEELSAVYGEPIIIAFQDEKGNTSRSSLQKCEFLSENQKSSVEQLFINNQEGGIISIRNDTIELYNNNIYSIMLYQGQLSSYEVSKDDYNVGDRWYTRVCTLPRLN